VPDEANKSDSARGAELRSATRHPYVHFTWFCRIGESSGHLGHTLDVSARGVAFLSTHEVEVGQRLLLVLVTPNGRVCSIVKVVHGAKLEASDPPSWRVGVNMEVVPPTDTPVWENLANRANEEPR
jgi:hypothetical protein